MIRSGAKLVSMLVERGFSPDAALWFYFADIGEWKLMLAEFKLSSEGPRAYYRVIQEVMSAAKPELEELSLDSVALVLPDTPIITLLSRAIKTGPGIGGIRFTNNVVNGTVIEDAHIYRLIPEASSTTP
jgi:hypothetical protein